jgi:translocation and assembly module TamA
VRVADKPDASGSAPVIVEVSERKPRTIGAGVNYASTEGAGGDVYWVHRNLFGEAETLRLEARIGRVLQADTIDDYDARFDVLFGKPGVFDPYTRWDLQASALQEDPEPYNRRGVVIQSLLTHDFTDRLSLSGGLAYDWARIDDAFGRDFYTILSIPTVATYDSRDSLLDPTEGVYSRLKLEPQYSVESDALFLTADSEMRGYLALDEDRRFVLAARGLAGTIYGADIEDIPAHRRFYAGGGGSVRGYGYLNIGPRIEGYGSTGGLARVEGSLEARIKVTETIGVVPFADAGFVTETSGFSGENRFQVGVGLGLRYYSPVGPLRLDVAVPLDPQKHDPDFAVYFGIGQAF